MSLEAWTQLGIIYLIAACRGLHEIFITLLQLVWGECIRPELHDGVLI